MKKRYKRIDSMLRIRKHYVGTKLLVESSINLIASDFLLGSRTYSISAAATLCINESANNINKATMIMLHKLVENNCFCILHKVDSTFMFMKEKLVCLNQRFVLQLTTEGRKKKITMDQIIRYTIYPR